MRSIKLSITKDQKSSLMACTECNFCELKIVLFRNKSAFGCGGNT